MRRVVEDFGRDYEEDGVQKKNRRERKWVNVGDLHRLAGRIISTEIFYQP